MATYVGGDANGGNFTTLTGITWPATDAGDIAFVAWTMSTGGVPTTPTGFTLIGNDDDSTCRSYLFWRVCDGAESGDVSLTCATQNRQSATLAVYRGLSTETPTVAVALESGTDTTHDCPSVSYSGNKIIFTHVSERVSTGTINGTPPAGFTQRVEFGTGGTGATWTAWADNGLTAVASPQNPGDYTGTVATATAVTRTIAVADGTSNAPPVSGANQTNITPGATVTISATDTDGTIASVAQTGGSPTVTLSGSGESRTFTAPPTIAGTTLTFTFTDDEAATDTQTVTVLPATVRVYTGSAWAGAYIRTIAAPVASTLFGACPIGNDGDPQTAASVTSKWGSKASARLFFGSTLTIPTRPAGLLLHCSWKPPTTVTDVQIDTMLAAMAGHIVTFYHESDNDGLDAAGRATRIALWNRLYDRNVALGRPCIVSHVFVGTFWSDSTSDATRDQWMASARGDLIGLDYDGVHDLHTSAPPDGITYYANTGSQTSASNKMTPASRIANIQRYIDLYAANGWTGYCVPEFGTSRATWDTDGAGRTEWMEHSNQLFINSGAFAVHAYDDRAGSPLKDDVLYVGTPEYDYWASQIALNP